MNRWRKYFTTALVTMLAAGCALGPVPQEEPSSQPGGDTVAEVVGPTVVEGGGAITTLSPMTVLSETDIQLDDDEATIRQKIEEAIYSSVAQAECVSLQWHETTATIDLDACRIPSTNEVIDGAVTIEVKVLQNTMILTLDDLTVGPAHFDGSVSAWAIGPLESPTFGAEGDMVVSANMGTLSFEQIDVEGNLDGMTISGTGTVLAGNIDASATMNDLYWSRGDCTPSGGQVAYRDGAARGEITFLPITPETGKVKLRVFPFRAKIVKLLEPCP